MKPAPFTYCRPDNVEQVLDLLRQHGGDSRILAGGQTLMAMLNMRLVEPKILVDISMMEALRFIRVADNYLEIGAAVIQADLLAWTDLEQYAPLMAKALPWVGHAQTRNKGTVCGSIAHSDPSSEMPLCLALLGGEIVLRSKTNRRMVKAADFQIGTLTTARQEDELIEAIRIPVPADVSKFAFQEVAIRHGDFALVAVAASHSPDGIRLGVGGVADRPEVRHWEHLPEDEIDTALNDLAHELGGYDDIHASAGYRRELVRTIGKRVILEVMA